MDPHQVYFQVSPGRKQVADSTQLVSLTGALEKTMSKFIGDLKIVSNYAVANHEGSIIQTFYGKLILTNIV